MSSGYRGAAEVSRTLQYHAAEVLEKYPSLEKVRGGIVFTKEEAIFKFQPGRPTFWGPLNFWIKILHEAEVKVELDRRSTLAIGRSAAGTPSRIFPGWGTALHGGLCRKGGARNR